jgi:hypothetical protein
MEGSVASDILVGRAGDTLTGVTQTPSFKITTQLGDLDVPTPKIRRVHFKSSTMPNDQLWLANGDLLNGTIRNDVIAFKTEDGTVRKIQASRVNTIMIGWLMDSRGLRLTEP